MTKAFFSPGDMVVLRSDPTRQGAVIRLDESGKEPKYGIFIDGTQKTFYEKQLQAFEAPLQPLSKLAEYQARLTALLLTRPGRQHLYAFNSGDIQYIPYQYRPVLKLVRADRPRLLIADEVGVGKTIEAGLIMKELQARQEINSVLIVCPRPLVTERKWEKEMKRFGERFEAVDGPRLKQYLKEAWQEGEWPLHANKLIVPFSLFRQDMLEGNEEKRSKGWFDLNPPPKFDLLIVDEAHYLRNAESQIYQGVSWLCQQSEAIVFLSATPIQLGERDLFSLLNLLRPDLIRDLNSFDFLSEPNKHLYQAVEFARKAEADWKLKSHQALNQALSTAWGQTRLKRDARIPDIQSTLHSDDTCEKTRVKLIRKLEELNSFSGYINRTRRRDIGQFTQREAITVEAPFTSEQAELYQQIIDIRAQQLKLIHGTNINKKFMLSMLMRQASSCLPGLLQLYSDNLQDRKAEFLEAMPEFEAEDWNEHLPLLNAFAKIVNSSSAYIQPDHKLEKLVEILKQKQELPNNKVIVFTTFRHTISYLEEHLCELGFRIGVTHGGTKDFDRRSARGRFKLSAQNKEAFDILLSSEIGCEGLDFQFCDTLINYDLPWNPMRIEQRIGRIDRFGQESPKVLIYNLITPGTIDFEIYDRCLLRLGIFKASLGGNEAVLGDIHKEILDLVDTIEMTEAQKQERLQQLADNKIRILQEQQALEEQEASLLGLKVPKEIIEKEVANAHSEWLSPKALSNLLSQYLSGPDHEVKLKAERSHLRMNDRLRKFLIEEFEQMSRKFRVDNRNWRSSFNRKGEAWNLVFNAEFKEEEDELISASHPLIRMAAQRLPSQESEALSCLAQSDLIPPGVYAFSVYIWTYKGPQQDTQIRLFSDQPDYAEQLTQLLSIAQDHPNPQYPDKSIYSEQEQLQHKVWDVARVDHIEKSKLFADLQTQSLEASYQARIAQVEQYLMRADNEKIRRMRQQEIVNLKKEYKRNINKLEKLTLSADIESLRLVQGNLTVEACA